MFRKKKETVPTHKMTLYRVHLYIGADDSGEFVTDVMPKMRYEEGISEIRTVNRYAKNWGGPYSVYEKITFDSFDVAYYETFEADVIDSE